jgi:Rps23 Pro-64 3,4-dihydroxylase Tpa1-like proline 4-hydroxylase
MALTEFQPQSRLDFFDMKSILPLQKMQQNIEQWAQQYRENEPYSHIGIDDFFDEALIRDLMSDYLDANDPAWKRASFDPRYEEKKLSLDRLEDFPPRIRLFVETLNSRMFLEFLEQLTGIDGLIPDPYLTGGGLHMTPRGGRLGIHADFNVHQKLGLDRRLNLLLYLNNNWQAEWGGEFELWDKEVKAKVRGYLPLENRVVVFSTTDQTFHGHPEPLKCPKGAYRRSIALYYYSRGRSSDQRSESHSTLFRNRPNEKRSATREVARQVTPPFLWEIARRRLR